MSTTQNRTWEHALVAECEAFLSGHLALCLGQQKRLVPAWAWLNALAHGSEDDIAALAAARPEPPGANSWAAPLWHQALAFLAHELMYQVARQGRPLAELQRSTLVPLELELARRSVPTSTKPGELVASVLRALAEHPTSRRR